MRYLSCDSVRACWEHFGDAGCVEAVLRQAHGCTKPSASSTHDHGIVLVVNDFILLQIPGQISRRQAKLTNSHRLLQRSCGPVPRNGVKHNALSATALLKAPSYNRGWS